jgi:hypothetical protein
MNEKRILQGLGGAIFLCMSVVTVRASLALSLRDAWASYAANPWAVATLWDAYSGFFLFFAWVCFRERTMGARVLWFFLIMGLGNIATSAYLLIQISRLRSGDPARMLLLPRGEE